MSKKFECFCDISYYDLWAVRPIGEKRWGYCYHLPTKEEAEGLKDELNKIYEELDKLKNEPI